MTINQIKEGEPFMVGKDRKVYCILQSNTHVSKWDLCENSRKHWIGIGNAEFRHNGFVFTITENVIIMGKKFECEHIGYILAEECNNNNNLIKY
jgi:hypothetical protein